MKIAMMVRGYIPVPRPADIVYAPIDLSTAIANGLAKKGHQVDFFGPAGTRLGPEVNVRTRNLKALVHNQDEFQYLLSSVDLLTHYVPAMWDQYLSSEMFRRAQSGEYDILHFQHTETATTYASFFPKVPVVYSLNDPVVGWAHDVYKMFHSPNQYYVSISNNQRLPAPHLQYADTIYNGTDVKKFKFSATNDDYLLFVGRIVPEKGVHEAVKVARATNNKLLIIGPVYEDKKEYFDSEVLPYLNDQIQYLGYIEHDKLVPYFQKAKALLMPIQWEEPFGLTMTEAMSCGTPVIAISRGSAPEVIINRKTGYLVKDTEHMIKAVSLIDKIDRKDCRDHVVENFSENKMVNHYEQVFKQIIRARRRVSIKKTILKPIPKKIKANIKKLR